MSELTVRFEGIDAFRSRVGALESRRLFLEEVVAGRGANGAVVEIALVLPQERGT